MMKLFVIEGVDGAGKSTQIKLLRDYFSNKGHKCEYLHFPRTDSPYFGELIARFLRGEFGSLNDVSGTQRAAGLAWENTQRNSDDAAFPLPQDGCSIPHQYRPAHAA